MINLKWIENNQSDLKLFKELFDGNKSPRTIEHLKWQYFESYNSKNACILSSYNQSSKRLEGVYAVFQSRFLCNGAKILGSQSLDTLVSIEARGKGLFNKLSSELYKNMPNLGVSFVYGFPNSSSAHGFFNNLGWENLNPLPFMVLPINIKYIFSKIPFLKFVAKVLPDIRIVKNNKRVNDIVFYENLQLDSSYNELWIAFSKKIKVSLVRDNSYLNWRLSRPGEKYNNIAVLDEEGNIQAICFYCLKNKHGGSIGYIMDLICLDNDLGTVLLNKVILNLRSLKCDAILAWNFKHSPNHRSFVENGFMNLPSKLRPIKLNFGVKLFSENNEKDLLKRESWYLSYFDSDTV